MGLIVFFLDWYKEHTGWNIPAMMTTFYLSMICLVIMIAVSLWKPHRHTNESEKLVWDNPLDSLRGEAWKGIGNYKFLSLLLFVTMILLYVMFA